MRFLSLIVFISISLPIFGQWKYKSKYKQGIFVETLGLSRGASINYNPILYHGEEGFIASSIGVSFNFGNSNSKENLTENHLINGIGLPVTLTYNYSLGDLDKRIRGRVTRKCMYYPQRFEFEWFGEGGIGYNPTYYPQNQIKFDQFLSGYLGLRAHLLVSRPYKNSDLVLFLRGGYSPYFRFKPNAPIQFKFLPHETGAVGASLGLGF